MRDERIIDTLWRYGHFFSPEALSVGLVREIDLPRLTRKDKVVKEAMKSYQSWMGFTLDGHAMNLHGRSAFHDGDVGPATEIVITEPRCGHPEYEHPEKAAAQEPAVGSGGNWPRCHGIGEFHAAAVVIHNSPPAHLTTGGRFAEILRRVTKCDQEIGLQYYWGGPGSPIQDGRSPHQLDFYFVKNSPGWIGYAQVKSNQPCNSRSWSQYLETYMRSSSVSESIIRMWTILILHELTHNKGAGHTRGGIMNPSILSLAASWRNDPLWNWHMTRYSRVPIPTSPDPDPDPRPDPAEFYFKGAVDLFQGDKKRGSFILTPSTNIF